MNPSTTLGCRARAQAVKPRLNCSNIKQKYTVYLQTFRTESSGDTRLKHSRSTCASYTCVCFEHASAGNSFCTNNQTEDRHTRNKHAPDDVCRCSFVRCISNATSAFRGRRSGGMTFREERRNQQTSICLRSVLVCISSARQQVIKRLLPSSDMSHYVIICRLRSIRGTKRFRRQRLDITAWFESTRCHNMPCCGQTESGMQRFSSFFSFFYSDRCCGFFSAH